MNSPGETGAKLKCITEVVPLHSCEAIPASRYPANYTVNEDTVQYWTWYNGSTYQGKAAFTCGPGINFPGWPGQ